MKNDRFKIILVILAFFCLSFILTRPLVFYFNRGIPYSRMPAQGWEIRPLCQGDHLQLYYHLWLAKDALRGKHPFFINPYEFSVDGIKIFTVRRLPLSILFVFFSVFGGAFAYNTLIILSIIFSGLAMFLLAKFYLKKIFPSFIAGLIYASSPFALSQLLGGHTNGFLWGLVPLVVFSLEALFRERKLKYGAVYLLCLFSFALIEYHLLYYVVLFSCLILPVRTITSLARWKAGGLNLRKNLIKVWVPVIISLLIVFALVFFLKHIEISTSIAQEGRSLSEVKLYSPGIGDLFKRLNPDSEKNIYLGIASLFLALLGLGFNLFRRVEAGAEEYEEKINLFFFGGGFLLSGLLALGTALSGFFPLYDFCYKFIPYFNYPRVPGRIIVITFLCLAVLAGYGVREIYNFLSKFRRRGWNKFSGIFAGSFIILAVFFEYYQGSQIGLSLFDKNNEIYNIIKENAGEQKVLELPLWPGDTAWSSIYLHYVTHTRVKIINGYYPLVPRKYVDEIFYPLIGLNLGDLTGDEYQLLKKLRVKYIVLHEEAFPEKVSHFRSTYSVNNLIHSPYLKFIRRDKLIWLFQLLDEPNWDKALYRKNWLTGVVKSAEQFHHHTGRLIDDSQAENGRALFASLESDFQGSLLFGRQQVFPRGKYKIIFHLKTDDNTLREPVALLDICTDAGREIIVQRAIKGTDFEETGKYQDFIVDFTQDAPVFPEFRVKFLKKANLWIDYLYILFADQNDPLYHYETDKLYYRGLVIDENEASEGKTVLFSPGFSLDKEVLYGPYRRFPRGIHEINFRLKTDRLADTPLAELEVTSNFGREKLAGRLVKGSDFKKAGVYQDFSFPFILKKDRILEFRMVYSNKEKLWVDKIEVKPIR